MVISRLYKTGIFCDLAFIVQKQPVSTTDLSLDNCLIHNMIHYALSQWYKHKIVIINPFVIQRSGTLWLVNKKYFEFMSMVNVLSRLLLVADRLLLP
jgi:hypothetical protein